MVRVERDSDVKIIRRMRAAERRGLLAASALVLIGALVTAYFVTAALAAPKPPAPTITGKPANPTATATTASATFTFTDSAGLTFKCSLDGSAFAACASGKSYSVLGQGNHTFSVEAFSGSTASNATSYSWAIVPPTPTITGHPANPTGSTSATFTFNDTQPGVIFHCSLDASSFGNCASGKTYNGLAGGNHTFRVEAQHGTTPPSAAATFAWAIDKTAPTIALTFPTSGGSYNAAGWAAGCAPAGICGTATDPSGVTSVAVAVLQQSSGKYWNGATFSSSTRTFNTASGTSNWNYAMARPANGTYTTYVRATDGFGNVTTSTALMTRSFTIDTVAPAAPVLTNKPSNPSSDTTPAFQFTNTSRPVTFTCRLDSGASVNCTGDTDQHGNPHVQGEIQYNTLAAGNHCFSVFATDPAGNVGPTTMYCWTILGNTTANTVAVSSGSSQITSPGTAFGAPLVAKVTDASNNPVSGISVTFTAPASGPSGVFGSACSGQTCVVATNASGLATSPTFTANSTSGGYTVTATATGVATPANFSLFNSMSFTVSGNAPSPFSPGLSQALNLLVTNPNPSAMTIPAGGISLTMDTGNTLCPAFGPAPANFTFTSLGAAVVIPANTNAAVSLTSLGVTTNNLPVLKMNNTAVNQDACKHLTLTLHYTGSGSGS